MAEEDSPEVSIEPVTPPAPNVDSAEPETAQATASAPEEAEPTPAPAQTAQIPVNEPLPPAPASAPQAHTSSTSSPQAGRDLLVKARATIQNRKHVKLEKILAFLNTKQKITNDEVEKLLHVSDATATRYLSQLEKEGKIKQQGKTGKAVTYTKP